MFRKLKNKFSNLKFESGKEQVSYGGVITYQDAKLAEPSVFDVIPERFRSDFCLSVMTIVGEVPPHTDSEIKCTINFYTHPSMYITRFFIPTGELTSYQVENQTNGAVYGRDNLACTGAFFATPGEAYLLDVTQIHAVDAVSTPEVRIAVCLGTDKYNYNEVSEMLNETGN
jgi:hypothetical protein